MVGKGVNLVAVAVVTALSAAAAWLTYGVLDSTGAAEQPGLRLGGAVVGFLGTFGLLAGLLKWLQKFDRDGELSEAQQRIRDLTKKNERDEALTTAMQEIRELRAKNSDLSSQLVRGLTLPDGYVAEIIDHHKLVVARPDSFVSRGGVILDYTAKAPDQPNGDEFLVDVVPAHLWVSFQPSDSDDPDKFYREYAERARHNPRVELMSLERTFIGPEERPRAALKVTTRSVARVIVSRDPAVERCKLTTVPMKRDEWPEPGLLDRGQLRVAWSELADPGFERIVNVPIRTAMVACLHQQSERVFFFVFEDDEDDFTEAVGSFHCCLRSVQFLG